LTALIDVNNNSRTSLPTLNFGALYRWTPHMECTY